MKAHSPLLPGLTECPTQEKEYAMIGLKVNIPKSKEFIKNRAKAP